jgi:hypothetical protein
MTRSGWGIAQNIDPELHLGARNAFQPFARRKIHDPETDVGEFRIVFLDDARQEVDRGGRDGCDAHTAAQLRSDLGQRQDRILQLLEKPAHGRFELPRHGGRRNPTRRSLEQQRPERIFQSLDAARQGRL